MAVRGTMHLRMLNDFETPVFAHCLAVTLTNHYNFCDTYESIQLMEDFGRERRFTDDNDKKRNNSGCDRRKFAHLPIMSHPLPVCLNVFTGWALHNFCFLLPFLTLTEDIRNMMWYVRGLP